MRWGWAALCGVQAEEGRETVTPSPTLSHQPTYVSPNDPPLPLPPLLPTSPFTHTLPPPPPPSPQALYLQDKAERTHLDNAEKTYLKN